MKDVYLNFCLNNLLIKNSTLKCKCPNFYAAFKNPILQLTFVFGVVFIVTHTIDAQTRLPMFNYISDEVTLDSLRDLPLMTAIDSAELFEEIYFVKISRPADIQINGLIDINLIDSINMDTLTIQTKYFEPTDSLTEFFYGDIVESDTINHLEYTYLMREGRYSAEINYNSRFYRLVSIAGDTCYLGKRIQKDTVLCGIPEIQDTSAIEDFINSLVSYDSLYKKTFDTVCVIRVMALYPNEFLAPPFITLNGITNEVITGIGQMNQALRNSSISRSIRFEFAGIRRHDGITQLGWQEGENTDVTELLRNWNDLPLTEDYRDEFEADLIVFLSGNVFIPGLLGGASSAGAPPNPDRASILVWPGQVNEDYTFVHEISHLMGCAHRECHITQHSGCSIINLGMQHAFKIGGWFLKNRITAVHTFPENNEARLLRFSNPRQLFWFGFIRTTPLGIEDEADNARIIRNNACAVADYHPGGATPPKKQVHISGPDVPCPCSFVDLYGRVIGFDPGDPLTYQWAHSTDGFNYTNLSYGLAQSLSVVTSCEQGTIDFYRLEVTNTVTSEVLVGYHTIMVGPTSYCDEGPFWMQISSSEERDNSIKNELSVELFPNPASNLINLKLKNSSEFSYNSASDLKSSIIGSFGEILHTQHSITSINSEEINISVTLDNMINGVYFIRLNIGDQTFIDPIIIQQ